MLRRVASFVVVSFVVVGAVLPGCAHRGPTAEVPDPPDHPVPASEPRATVTVLVELEPGPDCEERFDLQLYTNRAVDLIEWDDQTGQCFGRKARIRYLSERISERELLQEVARYAHQAKVMPNADGGVRTETE